MATEIKMIRDVAYKTAGPNAQQLDLYLPQLKKATPAPLFVFIHGGAWVSGDKAEYANIGRAIAAQGIAVAVINYRLSNSSVQHPEYTKDGASSLHWLRTHAQNYQFDLERIFVGGHSAGAHMTALLALDPQYLKVEGERAQNFRGYIGLEGIYDIPKLVKHYPSYDEQFISRAFSSDQAKWRDASPALLHFAKGPAWLVIQSNGDELVNDEQSDAFVSALKSVKTPVDYVKLKNLSHFDVVGNIGKAGDEVTPKIVKFINSHLN